jgi:hypothetical protein
MQDVSQCARSGHRRDRLTNEMEHDALDGEHEGEEEDELDDLVDAGRVRCKARGLVVWVVELVDATENDGPAGPAGCCVKERLRASQ